MFAISFWINHSVCSADIFWWKWHKLPSFLSLSIAVSDQVCPAWKNSGLGQTRGCPWKSWFHIQVSSSLWPLASWLAVNKWKVAKHLETPIKNHTQPFKECVWISQGWPQANEEMGWVPLDSPHHPLRSFYLTCDKRPQLAQGELILLTHFYGVMTLWKSLHSMC